MDAGPGWSKCRTPGGQRLGLQVHIHVVMTAGGLFLDACIEDFLSNHWFRQRCATAAVEEAPRAFGDNIRQV